MEATDRRWARVKVFETLIRRMEEGIAGHGCLVPADDIPEAVTDADRPKQSIAFTGIAVPRVDHDDWRVTVGDRVAAEHEDLLGQRVPDRL